MPLSVDVIRAVRTWQEKGLPENLRRKVMLHIADTVGISLAAWKGAPVAANAIAGIARGCSGGSGRVIGTSLRLPPAYAAFANTALGHAMDYDDIHDLARIHPTPVTLAAALAAADAAGSPATDLVTAVGIGNEFVCRLGQAIQPKGNDPASNWFLSQLFGYFSAAITAGLVLGLSDEELVHALGIAYMQAAGGKEPGVGVGSNARAIYPAFASMGGVQAVLLSCSGVSAPDSVLDGKTGFFNIYLGRNLNEAELGVLLESDSWSFAATNVKLYPSCRYSHLYIGSALALYDEIKNEPIQKFVIGVNKTAAMLCTPLKERSLPKTLQDAKFSLPFLIAFALVHGRVEINNLTDEALDDSRVLALAERAEMAFTQEDVPGIPMGDVTVVTSRGTYGKRLERVPEVSEDQVREKFYQCCRFAGVSGYEDLWHDLMVRADYSLIDKLPILSNQTRISE